MDQQTQPQPPVQQPPAGQTAPQKKSKTWLWILGGCLTVLLIIGIVIAGLVWWGARKAKKAYESNVKPQLEEMQKEADQWKGKSDEWQEDMEKMQEEMPDYNSV